MYKVGRNSFFKFDAVISPEFLNTYKVQKFYKLYSFYQKQDQGRKTDLCETKQPIGLRRRKTSSSTRLLFTLPLTPSLRDSYLPGP